MNRVNSFLCLCGVCAVGTAASLLPADAASKPDTTTVLVTPARRQVLKTAFCVNRVHPMVLVSYDGKDSSQLYRWTGQDWVPLSMADYNSGSFLPPGSPAAAAVIGLSAMVPAGLTAQPAWAVRLDRIDSLDAGMIVDTLGNRLPLRDDQWRWVARELGLNIEDQNAERRRWGRYGPPGQVRDSDIPVPPMAPAAVVTTPAPAASANAVTMPAPAMGAPAQTNIVIEFKSRTPAQPQGRNAVPAYFSTPSVKVTEPPSNAVPAVAAPNPADK